MGSCISNFAGRRGDILWKSNIIGIGGRRDYDTHRAWGIVLPFLIFDPIHTFGWGQRSYQASAIRLRADCSFRLQALLCDWSCLLSIAGLVASPILGCLAFVRMVEQQPYWMLFAVGSILSTIAFVVSVCILLWVHRVNRRDRDIRILLGAHTWGSSDPAYWHQDLLREVIVPANAFGIKNFAELASKSLQAGDWNQAIWAARLCTATEDLKLGESLTSEILAQKEIQTKLRLTRNNPSHREEYFGQSLPLETWVHGNPQEYIFDVSC
jgi:hypothetical protein